MVIMLKGSFGASDEPESGTGVFRLGEQNR